MVYEKVPPFRPERTRRFVARPRAVCIPINQRLARRTAHARALDLHGRLEALANPTALAEDWMQLQAQSECSFFLSWSWIGAWLEVLPAGTELYVYRCYDGPRLLGLCIVSRSRIRRRRIFSSQVLGINEVFLPGLDMAIEYNGLLARRGYEAAAAAQLLRDIQQSPLSWDEILFSGVPQKRWREFSEATSAAPLHSITDEIRSPWVTHLPTLGGAGEALFASPLFTRMSSNRRWQIKRSFKEYEKIGPLTLHEARSFDEALLLFDAMGAMHTQRWNQVGCAGSFANPLWVDFHRTLIRLAFDRGELQMLRINCGELAIGYIYNFLWRGRVYMLQSGLALQKSNALRPGYVSHCLAIHHNAKKGLHYYDFMCGDSDYKSVLGQADQPLVWARLQKPRWRFKIESALVGLYRRMKALRAALTGDALPR